MKIIFLDIDGVLNYAKCSAKSATGCLGIDDAKCKLLSEIVVQTSAKVVLTSTWKTDWMLCENIEDLPRDGYYLETKLRQHNIHIIDKTEDPAWSQRGVGIRSFLESTSLDVEQFVIIDDESFDFHQQGLASNFVKTSFTTGILPEHVEKAVNILNDSKS